MIRTALRLGILPLLAALLMCGAPTVPLWDWCIIALLSPLIVGSLLLSYQRRESDPLLGVVPLWARKFAPWIWAISISVMLSVPLTSWPMHRAFGAARPRLERLIADEQAGKSIVWPQSAGGFELSNLQIEAGRATFYLAYSNGNQPDKLIRLSHFEDPQWRADLLDDNSLVVLSENWIYEDAGD